MKRDQTVYTCDGCRTTEACEFQGTPPGWYRVTTAKVDQGTANGREHYLCLRCYAGVDWIIRFQGLTVPPVVVADPKPLHRLLHAARDDESILDSGVACPAVSEHHLMEHCGLCGYERVKAPLNITVDVLGDAVQIPGDRHVHNHEPPSLGITCPETRSADGNLYGACVGTPESQKEAEESSSFSIGDWAQSLLEARFPGEKLRIMAHPLLDIDFAHGPLAHDLVSVHVEIRALRPIPTPTDDTTGGEA